ncbi:MAG: hypothetical protein PVH30_01600 [Desulfobacterales bacterium]
MVLLHLLLPAVSGHREFGLLVPLGLMKKFCYYCLYLLLEIIAIYFLVTSVWYWVQVNTL